MINRSSDSLSKCDPGSYSNIYDARKRPDVKNHRVTPSASVQKDTIEISHDKLKKEALSRLRSTTKVVIAQNSFMRIGKYLFLAIAFPPYLLLYGLPKWILVEGLPAIFSIVATVWKKVQNAGKQHFEKGARHVSDIFHSIKKSAQVLIQPIVRLAFEIRHGIARLMNRGGQLFKRMNEKSAIALSTPGRKIKAGIDLFRKKMSQAKEKLVDQTQLLASRLKEGIQWINQTPVALISWGQLQFGKLANQVESKKGPFVQKFRSSQQNAQKATEWIARQFQRGAERIKRNFEPLSTFVREQILPLCSAVKQSMQRKWKGARNFFQQKQQKSLAFLERKQTRLKELTFQHLINHISSQAWLPNKLKAWIKKWLSNPIIKIICETGISLYSFIGRSFFAAIALLLQAFSKGTTFISKTFGQVGFYTKSSALKILAFLKGSLRIFRKAVLYALYYGILYMMMAGIVFAMGIRSLGTLMGFFKKLVLNH